MLALALRNGQKMGVVADGDADLFATFTVGALKETLLDQTMTGKSVSREQLVTALNRLLESGYLRTPVAVDAPVSLDDARRRRERT
jgi:hypothetical protein